MGEKARDSGKRVSLSGSQDGVRKREKKVISKIPNHPTSQRHSFLLLHTSGLCSRSSLPGMSSPFPSSHPKPAQALPPCTRPRPDPSWESPSSFLACAFPSDLKFFYLCVHLCVSPTRIYMFEESRDQVCLVHYCIPGAQHNAWHIVGTQSTSAN